MLGGCVSDPPPIVGEAALRAALPDVVPGETTREAMVLRFGPPDWAFQDGRILTWRVRRDDAGEFHPLPPASVVASPFEYVPRGYGLVVIFDEHGVVARFNLVEEA